MNKSQAPGHRQRLVGLLLVATMAIGWGLAIPWLSASDAPDPIVFAGLGFALIMVVALAMLDRYDRYVWAYLILVPISQSLPHHDLITDAMTLGLLALYGARKVMAGQLELLQPPRTLAITIPVYLVVILVSALASEYPRIGLMQFVREIMFYIVVLVLFDWLRTRRQWILASQSLVWIGLAISVSICADWFMRGPSDSLRSAGLFVSPTRAALVLTTVFPPALGYLASLRRRGVWWARWVRVGLIVLTLIAAALTQSRNAMMIVGLSLVLVYWPTVRRHTKATLIAAGLAVVLIGAGIWLSGIGEDLVARLRLDRGLSGRGYIWQSAWNIYLEHPVLGTGPSTFRYYVVDPQTLEPYGSVEDILVKAAAGTLESGAYWVPGLFGGVIGNNAHNLFLGTLANTGLVGLVAVLGVLAAIYAVGARAIRAARDGPEGIMPEIVYGCWVTLLVAIVKLQFEEGIFRGSLVNSLPIWLVVLLAARAPSLLPNTLEPSDPIKG